MGDGPTTLVFVSFSNVTDTSRSLAGVLSDEFIVIFQWVIFACVCQAIDLFGIGTNVINIVCFIKQGFKDPVNISLLGLAIADLGCLTTLVWSNICYTPAFSAQDLPFDTVEFQFLTSGMPHTTFTRITGWITAIITLERCLCITMPLKVKEIFTRQRVSAVIICTFLILIASVSPLYVVYRLGMKYFPERNKTLLGLIHREKSEHLESVSYTINNVVIPGGAFVMIIVCTIILVINLERGKRWREKSMVNEQAKKMSIRNQRIAKMVLMISILFICCFIPVSFMFLAMSVEPEFSLLGKFRNMLSVIGGLGIILESVNSSANIFIYYRMSSKYRVAFDDIFCVHVQRSRKYK